MKKQNFLMLTTTLIASTLFAHSASAASLEADQESYNLFNVWHQQTSAAAKVPTQETTFNANYTWTFAAPEGTVVNTPVTETAFKGNYSWNFAKPAVNEEKFK